MNDFEPYLSYDDVPLMLTVDELGKLLRVSRNTAYMLVKEGHVRSVQIGRQIRIPKDGLRHMF